MIIIDTREKHIDKIKELIANYPVGMISECPTFEFKCLGQDLGDYLLINGEQEFAIERKNISDFCATYPHLKKRLALMRLHYNRVGLLLEGTYTIANDAVYVLESNVMKPRMSYKAFSNFLLHQSEAEVKIIHTMSFEETFYRLIHIHNKLPKLATPTPSFKAGNINEWLAMLPGVGAGTLEKMHERYDTPLDAIENGLPKKAKDLLGKW